MVSDYEFNNTYQYVIAREDVHLQWLEAAIAELGGTPDQVAEPHAPARAARRTASCRSSTEDAREAEAFVARWRAAARRRSPTRGTAA